MGPEGLDRAQPPVLEGMEEVQPLRAGTWKIDALHSQVMVSVWHFNVANLRAKFPRVSGGFELDTGDPFDSAFQVEIEAASVTTGHPRQEEFMRSELWLDAERHPLITFTGTEIEPLRRDYKIEGDLTLKGVTRRVEIPFDFAALSATHGACGLVSPRSSPSTGVGLALLGTASSIGG